MAGLGFEAASQAVGTFVSGVNLRKLTTGEFEAIRQKFFETGVLFFRDQDMEPEDHIAFAERWAEIDINRFFTPHDGFLQIAMVVKEPDETHNVGGGWHTDHSYDQIPAMGSILRAIDLPETGGDTLFAGMAAAYDGLDDETKSEIEGLKATHSSRHIFGSGATEAEAVGSRFKNADKATQDAVHPIVLSHPETGRKGLYVNAAFTTGIVDMDIKEARLLLGRLYAHCVNEAFHYRFSWKPGSIAMWDNRSTWHWALNDYHGMRREMHRITLKGVPLAA